MNVTQLVTAAATDPDLGSVTSEDKRLTVTTGLFIAFVICVFLTVVICFGRKKYRKWRRRHEAHQVENPATEIPLTPARTRHLSEGESGRALLEVVSSQPITDTIPTLAIPDTQDNDIQPDTRNAVNNGTVKEFHKVETPRFSVRKLYNEVQQAIPSYGEGSDEDEDGKPTRGNEEETVVPQLSVLPVLGDSPKPPTTPLKVRAVLEIDYERTKPKLPPKSTPKLKTKENNNAEVRDWNVVDEKKDTEDDYYLMPVEEIGKTNTQVDAQTDVDVSNTLGVDPSSGTTCSSLAPGVQCLFPSPVPARRHTYDAVPVSPKVQRMYDSTVPQSPSKLPHMYDSTVPQSPPKLPHKYDSTMPQSPPKVPKRAHKPRYGYHGSNESSDYVLDDLSHKKLPRRYKQHVETHKDTHDKIIVSDNEHVKLTAKPYLPRAGQKLLFTCKVHHEYALTVRNITWNKRSTSDDESDEFHFQGYQCELPYITRRHSGEYECFVHAIQDNGNDLTFSGSIYIDVVSDDSEVFEDEEIPKTPPRDTLPIGNPNRSIRKPRLEIQLGSSGLKAVYDKAEIRVSVAPYPLIDGVKRRVKIKCSAKSFQAKDVVYYFGNLANDMNSKQLRGSMCILPPFKKQDGGHYKISVTRSHDNYQIYEKIYIPVYESLQETGLLKDCTLTVKHMLDEIDLMDEVCHCLDNEQPLQKNWQHLANYLLNLSDQQLCTIRAKSGSPTRAVFRKIKSQLPNLTCAELLQCLQEEMYRNDVITEIAKRHECLACHYFYYNV